MTKNKFGDMLCISYNTEDTQYSFSYKCLLSILYDFLFLIF